MLAEMNAEVLERHGQQMRRLEVAQRLQVR